MASPSLRMPVQGLHRLAAVVLIWALARFSRVAFTMTDLAVAWCEPDHNRWEAWMRIADVLRNKGGAVMTINPDATVTDLLAGLAGHNIGAMVVVGPDGAAAFAPGGDA